MARDKGTLSHCIAEWVESHREEAVELARALVSVDSVNHPPTGNEAACQRPVADWLREEGAEVDVYELADVPGLAEHSAYMAGRRYEGRSNVAGRFAAGGLRKQTEKGMLFDEYSGTLSAVLFVRTSVYAVKLVHRTSSWSRFVQQVML